MRDKVQLRGGQGKLLGSIAFGCLMPLSAQDITRIIHDGVPESIDRFLVERVESDGVLCRMRFNEKQLRPGGTVSGPTVMTLADAAMYAVILAKVGVIEMAVTQNININFLSKPAACDLLAYAVILKAGRRSVVLDVKLYSEGSDVLVAHATGIYALPAA